MGRRRTIEIIKEYKKKLHRKDQVQPTSPIEHINDDQDVHENNWSIVSFIYFIFFWINIIQAQDDLSIHKAATECAVSPTKFWTARTSA